MSRGPKACGSGMNEVNAAARLAFLHETVELEAEHLQETDRRLFDQPFTPERAASLKSDPLLAERLDAFGARFARLQDTAGDKLLPALLARLGEPLGSAWDNLARAERLQWLTGSAVEDWVAARALRNRIVHDYIRDAARLAEAVNEAHCAVPMLVRFVAATVAYARARALV